MAKTDPTSIRFDEDRLNYVLEQEKLSSRQKVVDFLLEKYWWEKKIGNPPTFERQNVSRESKSVPRPITPMPKITQFEAYKSEIIDAKSPQKIAGIVSVLKQDDELSSMEKRTLEQFGVQRSQEIDF